MAFLKRCCAKVNESGDGHCCSLVFGEGLCKDHYLEKLHHQLEIQTKRVENLKKMFMYGDPESWIKRNGDAWNKSSPREKDDQELIRGYKHPERDWIGTVVVGGKLARSCQAIDQELEKELEGVK